MALDNNFSLLPEFRYLGQSVDFSAIRASFSSHAAKYPVVKTQKWHGVDHELTAFVYWNVCAAFSVSIFIDKFDIIISNI